MGAPFVFILSTCILAATVYHVRAQTCADGAGCATCSDPVLGNFGDVYTSTVTSVVPSPCDVENWNGPTKIGSNGVLSIISQGNSQIVVGNSHKGSGNTLDVDFELTAATAVFNLENLEFKDFPLDSSTGTGCVFVKTTAAGAKVRIKNVKFTAAQAANPFISLGTGGKLEMNKTTFENCASDSSTSSGFIHAAADSEMTLAGVKFLGLENAVAIKTSGATALSIYSFPDFRTTFSGNQQGDIVFDAGTLIIADTDFVGITTGGVTSGVVIASTTASGNKITGSTFKDFRDSAVSTKAPLTVVGTTFTDNKAETTNKGAAINAAANLTVEYCTFQGNVATEGAAWFVSSGSTVKAVNPIMVGSQSAAGTSAECKEDTCEASGFQTCKKVGDVLTCSECASGKYLATGADSSKSCAPCATGSFTATANENTACTLWTVCSPGTHVAAAGSVSSDRSCTPCASGKFTASANENACADMANCAPGTFAAVGNASIDRTCMPCASGKFTASANENACADMTVCSPGTHVAAAGSVSSDRTCTPCASGKFTASANENACADMANCAPGTFATVGNASIDRTCTPCASGKFTASATKMPAQT